MVFETPVIASKPYEWSPQNAQVYPTPDRDATAEELAAGYPNRVFDVEVHLFADMSNGAKVEHTRTHTYPASMKAGIIGFDPVTMKPTINWPALNPVFAEFDLSIPQ